MTKAALTLLFSGLITAVYALTIPVFKDSKVYADKLAAIERSLYEDTYVDEFANPDPTVEYNVKRASRKFFALRQAQLSHRYELFDYGMCAALLGAVMSVVGLIGWRRVRAPNTRMVFMVLALLAAFSVPVAEALATFHDFHRGHAPAWADSLGVPLFSLMLFTPVMVFLSILLCLFLAGNYTNGVKLIDLRFSWRTAMPLLGAGVFFLLTVRCLYEGYFWMLLPVLMWLYLLLSVSAGRSPLRAR